MGKVEPATSQVATIISMLDQNALKLANLLDDKTRLFNETVGNSPEQLAQWVRIQPLIGERQRNILPLIMNLLSTLDMYYEYCIIREALRKANKW